MGSWALAKPKCLPAGLGMSLAVGLLGVFIIAICRQDVSPYIPFISEAGATAPESGIFCIFLYVTATLGIFTCILRYMIVEECNNECNKLMSVVNKATLVPGILSMVGMILVGAYPISENVNLVPHGIGALLLFGMSIFYGFGQAWVSYQMWPAWHNLTICRIRLGIMIASCICLVILTVCGILGKDWWSAFTHNHRMGMKTPEDEVIWEVHVLGYNYNGFMLLMVSAIAEWTLAFLFILYYITFIKEFTRVAVTINIHLLVTHFDKEVSVTDGRTALL